MRCGFLFAGIGGFELAAREMGWDLIWSNEIDAYCCKILRQHFDHEIIEADIREVTGNAEPAGLQGSDGVEKSKKFKSRCVDLICGGFPCQPFSGAGRRRGKQDDRYLWPEMLRIIRETQPAWVVGENVAGITSMENSTPFDRWVFNGLDSKAGLRRIYSRHIYRKRQTYVLNEILESLEAEGYQVQAFNIPAAAVGAWHQRQRVWIVGYSGRHGNASERYAGRDKSETKGTQGEIEGARETHGQRVRSESEPTNKDGHGSDASGSRGGQDHGRRKSEQFNEDGAGSWWQTESELRGVPDGLSAELDKDYKHRIKALGNAIVPQVAFEIFRAIEVQEMAQREDF